MTGVEVLRQAKVIRPETTRLLVHGLCRYPDGHRRDQPGPRFSLPRQALGARRAGGRGAAGRRAPRPDRGKEPAAGRASGDQRQAVEANRLKGAFIEVASHELNTPVTVVLGMLELWKMSQGPDVPRRRSASGSIGSAPPPAGWRGRSSGCSSWFEIGSSANRSTRQPIELEPLVQQAIDELAPYLELRRQLCQSRSIPILGADPGRSSQARRRADQPSGQRHQIHAGRRHDPDRGPAGATGRRTGCGSQSATRARAFPAADQQHLFEPFFTGFDTLRHSSGDYQFGKRGIGLGLWLVKTFVELHGGRVEVSRPRAAGSTFAFVLPRSTAILADDTPDQHKIALASHTRDATRPTWPAAV